MEREIVPTLLEVCQHNERLPALNLHDVPPKDVRGQLEEFLINLINNTNETAARIVYGRGGKRRLRQECQQFFAYDQGRVTTERLVAEFKEEETTSGGSCVVILNRD